MPRPAGVPNKRSSYARKVITEAMKGGDPLEEMVKMAQDETVEASVRANTWAKLAKFIHPELKAVEHTGDGGGALVARVEIVRADVRAEDQG